jgi:hypothetical protein
MSDIYKITDNLRVRDYDSQQYVIETRSVAESGKSKGQDVWTIQAYIGSVKSLSTHVARWFEKEHVDAARAEAKKLWAIDPVSVALCNLPPKPSKQTRHVEQDIIQR